VPASPTSSTMVFPKENRYCVFGGNYGHGVLDSGNEDERITFLVNWWRQKPEAIERCPENEVLPDDGSAAEVEEAMKFLALGGEDATTKADGREDNGESTQARMDERSHAESETYLRKQKNEETKQRQKEEEDIVVVQARAEDFEDPMIVDDFLALHDVDLCGNDTPAAVTIEHKGLMLCPIEVVKDSNEIIHVCGALLKED